MNWVPLCPRHCARGWWGRRKNKRMLFHPVPTPHLQIHSQMRRAGRPETSNLNTVRNLTGGIKNPGLVSESVSLGLNPSSTSYDKCLPKISTPVFLTCKIGINKIFIMWDIGRIKWGDLCVGLQPSPELLWWNLKLLSVHGGQEGTEERGRPLWVGRWQF